MGNVKNSLSIFGAVLCFFSTSHIFHLCSNLQISNYEKIYPFATEPALFSRF